MLIISFFCKNGNLLEIHFMEDSCSINILNDPKRQHLKNHKIFEFDAAKVF